MKNYSTRVYSLLFLVLLVACSREDDNPTLQAEFELAHSRYVIGQHIEIAEVTLGGVRYDWDFGNGLSSDLQRPTGITYLEPGVHTITLTVMSVGGSQTTTQREVIIGQHHVQRLELEDILPEFRDKNMDIYFTVSEIQSEDEQGRIEEEIFRSELLVDFNSNMLPVSWEVENIPLGSQGYNIGHNPIIRFFDAESDEVIAEFGRSVMNFINYRSEDEQLYFISSTMTGTAMRVDYGPVFPK